MSKADRDALLELTDDQLGKDVIEPSLSNHSSAVVLIPKPGGGVRFAIDFRQLNKNILGYEYTLPSVHDTMASLEGSVYFSTLDVREAFWNVPLKEECRKYTAFRTPSGLY